MKISKKLQHFQSRSKVFFSSLLFFILLFLYASLQFDYEQNYLKVEQTGVKSGLMAFRNLKESTDSYNFFCTVLAYKPWKFLFIFLTSFFSFSVLLHLKQTYSQSSSFDDEDDDELFLWYGWPTKGV